jgi:hypothetical protein
MGIEKIDLLVDGRRVHTRDLASLLETIQDFKVPIGKDVALGRELKVQAAVHDVAGNVGRGELALSIKDLSAPSVELSTSAAENIIRASEPLRVRIKAADRFGLASIQYRVTNALKDEGEFIIDPAEISAERELTLEVPSEAVGGGTIGLWARALDRAGNRQDTRWLSVRILDEVAPRVVSVQPADAATDVNPATGIRLRFSEGISRKSVNPESLVVRGPDGVVAEKRYFEYFSRWVDLKPDQPLKRGERYTVTATADITDPTGNPLKEIFTSHFTTDGTGPALAELLPADEADGVAALPVIRARFNEALKRETLTPEAISLVDAADEVVPTAIEWKNRDQTIELRPKEALALGRQYVIRVTGLLTDIAGNSITDADGKPIDVLVHRFTTGTIRFLSPQDGEQVLEMTRIPLEISPEGLAVASVVFEVNGKHSPAVPGTPFRLAYQVPAMADAPHLTITAVAMDDKGKEIARKSAVVTVVSGLQREPAILGVAEGGTSHFRLWLSVPLEIDLPIKLAIQEPSVVRLSHEQMVLKAGDKELRVPVEGVSKGNTFLTIQSERGDIALTVSVSKPATVSRQTISSLAMGLGIQPAAFTQPLHFPKIGDYTPAIPLLAIPAHTEMPVEVLSHAVEIVDVPDRVTIAAGSRTASVSLRIKAVGEAVLWLKVGDTINRLRLVVGEPVEAVPRFFSGVASGSMGLSVTAMPSLGPIHMPRTGSYTITVPLLSAPVSQETRVAVSSPTPAIIECKDDVSIAEGSQMATLALTAKGKGEGEIILTAGKEVYRVPIIVGEVETALPPAAASQPVGMSVTPSAFTWQIVVPHLGKRRISVPLLPSVTTEKIVVKITSDEPDVIQVQDKVVIPAGSRMAHVVLNLKKPGYARLKMQVGNDVTWLPIIVGTASETIVIGVGSVPLGVAVTPAGTAGRLLMRPGTKIRIRVPLLSAPATEEVAVALRNRHPEIARATVAAAAIPAGERALEIPLTAKPGAAGTAVIDLLFGDTLKTVEVIVGQPSAGDEPIIVSPVVGFEVKK